MRNLPTVRNAIMLGSVLALMCVGAFAQDGHRPPDEKTIRDGDAVWSQAAQTKDLDQTVSFYSDDASGMPFNGRSPPAKSRFGRLWSHLMSLPGYSLHFAPSKVEVASGGDLAYEVGTFELTVNDAQGAAPTTPGKYVVVWKKQPKGEWKAAADIFNTDKKSSRERIASRYPAARVELSSFIASNYAFAYAFL